MPRFVKTSDTEALKRLDAATPRQLRVALGMIALSALDDCQNGNDTAAVVYEQLFRLGITVP